MLRLLLFNCFLLVSVCSLAGDIKVKDIAELKAANKNAQPGDNIILQNGEWKDVKIELNCTGTKENPISFKAETAGKVLITGNSSLELGGNYIVVDGWYFTRGYAGKNAVINFRIDKNQLANNCRVTNTVINDFNNPKRMDENYWVSFSGKNNRIDHCSFLNKKNMGVLMAVVLDDERSRENFHSIDHNYFGVRLPLASNSGEIIRVGVSQHALFNSNTQIENNHFEHCDGETEIVSIKSSGNIVRNNFFEECQGGVVLRHGNNNTVEKNVFAGNNKPGTGGVRIINTGQWVVNNLFDRCRGTGFRSPLSLMNGVPNSPPIRYVEVSEAVVMNNIFLDCAPISLGEGSDTERTVAPYNVLFQNNFFENKTDPKIFNAYDKISGINFANNFADTRMQQSLPKGFIKTPLGGTVESAFSKTFLPVNDSLFAIAKSRLSGNFRRDLTFDSTESYFLIASNAKFNSRAKWFVNNEPVFANLQLVKCPDELSVLKQLEKQTSKLTIIQLTGKKYLFTSPLIIKGNVILTSYGKSVILQNKSNLEALIELKGNGTLALDKLNLDLSSMQAATFITSDLSGSSNHSNFKITDSKIKNLSGIFFTAAKSSMIDSIQVLNSSFENITGTLFNFSNENDKKGYYNVEKLKFNNNNFTKNKGQLLTMLRGGNDESTMGPLLSFTGNKIIDCDSKDEPLIKLYGTQVSDISGNTFLRTNTTGVLVQYEDAVRAAHNFDRNKKMTSGKIIPNKFVEEKGNITQ